MKTKERTEKTVGEAGIFMKRQVVIRNSGNVIENKASYFTPQGR
jgi:hypothetical protein